ncbi:MAG: SMP-30/gluconolactonase/LRE family protein [Kiritimatiellae bacterium]|nr:SMP-30/gluconolactonase/LRE family protein [Kiritimatiellia bacterium]
MKRTILALLLGTASLHAGIAASLDDIVVPGTVAKRVASGFSFAEGATANAEGEVFFTDQPNDQILRWNERDGLRVFLSPSGRANGMCFAPDGNLLVCADNQTEVWSISPDKKITVLTGTYEGKRFNGPNDIWVQPDGSCYFTDPFYGRSWWNYKDPPQPSRQVYYLPKGGKPRRVTDNLVQPNGIVGTPDGKRLYVSDINAKKTYVYDVSPDGSLTNRKLFCEMGSDGMARDDKGNLYLTGKGVFVFSEAGEKLGVIEIPESWCGNVCIGGKDHKTLFVTAMKGLYAVPLR